MDVAAVCIHNPSMRVPTPSPTVDRILTGHERRRLERCWRPAGTEPWLLIHTRAGRARIVYPGGELEVGPGETLLYGPRAPQDFGGVDPERPWEIVWAHFEPLPHWLELLRWPEVAPGIHLLQTTDAPALERIEGLLREADRLASSGLPHARLLARNTLEAAFLWLDVRGSTGHALDARVLAAIDYISRNPRRRLSVDELARVAHLSSSRFAQLFTRETGLTPRRFVERQRIDRAKQLLELTVLPVNGVAREVGFESQFYFATRFRRATGMTPTGYRARQASPEP